MSLPYRPCVGVVLARPDGLIFTGERLDTPGAWQMPQGGIDAGEAAEAAALRELEEETGVASTLVTVEAVAPEPVRYDFPAGMTKKIAEKFRGQEQVWYLMRFHGADSDVNIVQAHQEFGRWRWSTPEQVLADIVPFKRDVYAQVIAVFRERL